MITLMMLLILSAGINVFFIFYLRWLLKKFAPISENIGDMLDSMGSFSKHLEAIHELEMYYGEPTLKNLIEHSKRIVKDIEIYKDVYSLFYGEGEESLQTFEEGSDAEELSRS
ncbi:MAG: hypothetical protein CMB80_02390 [Flammeovirgaceae bacterium]|nr:hypothetical protein [Flammeovirgaceae bacterium]